MSPNPTDDLLVRDLHERADLSLPRMSLDPADVLVASRRHRRRQTVVRSAAGVLAVGAFVVGATQIWADEPATTPPAGVQQEPRPMGDGQTVELAPGVTAANRPVEMTLGDGTPVLDLGIMTSGPTQVPATTPNEEQSLVVSPISGEELAMANFPDMAPPPYDSGVQFTHLWESGLSPFDWGVPWSTQEATFDYAGQGYLPSPPGWTMSGSDGPALYGGAVPAAIPDPRVVLFSERGFRLADGTTTHSLEVPTYPAPTDDARLLWTVQVTEEQGFTGGELDPPVSVSLFIGSDGSVTTGLWCGGTTLQLCAEGIGPELYVAAGLDDPSTAGDTLSIQVAQDVAAVESSAGPVVDLGVPVRNDFARMMADGEREELTYAILLTTVGKMAAGAEVSLTPEEAAGDAVLLAGLKPFGALVPMSSSDLGTTRAAKDAGPILQAGSSTHDVNALGMLPAGSRATVVLVVERAGGTERVPVPTFRVPGVDEDFFFVALHDEAVDLADWPSVYVEVTDQEGTVTRRSLPGVHAVTISPRPPADPTGTEG